MKSGPIIAIEDDEDDMHLFKQALKALNVRNELIWFQNCADAWLYLKTTTQSPFLIFCDVNLPGQNGVDFKRQIDQDQHLRKKSIPFMFYSTSADQETVNIAYTEMTVQGFFKKPTSFEDTKAELQIILDYWRACRHPNAA